MMIILVNILLNNTRIISVYIIKVYEMLDMDKLLFVYS